MSSPGRKSMAKRSFSRGWIDAVHCGKERSSGIVEDFDKFLETETPEEQVEEVDKETFSDRLRLAQAQEEAHWRLNNPAGRAANKGQRHAKYREVTKRTDSWQRLGRRQPFRVPDGLLGRFGCAGVAEDEVLSSGTNSTLGSATPNRPMSASSNRPLSARSGGSLGRPSSARSRALVFRSATYEGSSCASGGRESFADGFEFGESKTARSTQSGLEANKASYDHYKRRTTTRVALGTLAFGAKAMAAERQLLLFQKGPSDQLKAQLEVARGDPILTPRKPRRGLQEMVQERACVRRLPQSPSPDKVRAGQFNEESESAVKAQHVTKKTNHRGLRKTLFEDEGHAPMVNTRRQPHLDSPNVGLGPFERD